MAVTIDRRREINNFNQKLAAAKAFLPDDPRAELMVSDLPKVPEGLKEGITAFEFSPRGLLRIIVIDSESATEIFPFGPINNSRRNSIAESFGFDSENSTSLIVTEHSQYPRRKQYYISTNC